MDTYSMYQALVRSPRSVTGKPVASAARTEGGAKRPPRTDRYLADRAMQRLGIAPAGATAEYRALAMSAAWQRLVAERGLKILGR